MKTRILHLISSSFYGGPEKQILEHLKRLDSDKYEGYVGLFIDNDNADEMVAVYRDAGIKVVEIPMSGPLDIRAFVRLATQLRRLEIGLLCSHGYKATVMAHFARLLFGVKTLAFSRGYTAENWKVALYEWLERKVLGRQTGVVAVSEGQLQKLKNLGVKTPSAWVVYNSVSVEAAQTVEQSCDSARIRRELGVVDGAKMVVCSGRLSPEKGHRYLVEAIAQMPGREAGNFVFCGDGVCMSALKKQAEELGVLDLCRFVGFKKNIMEIYYAMDLLVLPSLTEGLPNVVLEAFSLAKPVVATSVGGVPELVEDKINGKLVKPGAPEELAKAIGFCMEEVEAARVFGIKGLQTVKERFTFEAQNQKLEAIYGQLL